MRCATCGGELPPARSDCPACNTPAGDPAVRPDVRAYGVRAVGLAAVIAVAATAVADLALGLTPLVGRALAERARDSADPGLLDRASLIESGVATLALLVQIAAATLVIVWLYRARRNLDAFPGAGGTLGAGWAIGGWFVPFANFVVPVRVVANVARDSLWRLNTPVLVWVWWAAWVVVLVGDRVVGPGDRALPSPPVDRSDYQRYVDHYADGIIGRPLLALVEVVAAVTLGILVLRISAAQEARIARGRAAAALTPVATVAAPAVPGSHIPGGGATIAS